jgi:adenine deaminase
MANLRELISVARGEKKADLLLKNGQLVNVLSSEIYPVSVAIHKDRIVGVGDYQAEKVVDLNGQYICPGFIDAHVHIESSMLVPSQFSLATVPHGVTSIIADPHEIANVLGIAGIKYLLEASANLPQDMFFMLPSCVPATTMETSGADLKAKDLKPLLRKDRVLGLAELMNFPGVLCKNEDILDKIGMTQEGIIDGHCPNLSGKDLAAYILSGPSSDHECTTLEEAREKLRLGMQIFVRESSSAKNMQALLGAITKGNARGFSFCTDDMYPKDLIHGSMDRVLAKAVELGLDPMLAVQLATINTAEHYGLRKMGAIAPGYLADIAVVNNLHDFKVSMVVKSGKIVVEKGRANFKPVVKKRAAVKETVSVKPLKISDVKVKAKDKYANVIQVVPGQVLTKKVKAEVIVENGLALSDPNIDILKLLVVERHKATGNIGLAFVKGFGLKKGAIASSVSHDSHNIIAVGVTDEDILSAVREVIKLKGGMVVVSGGLVLAELPLPVAGLMSEEPLEDVVEKFDKLEASAQEIGCTLPHPFGTLSFLALPVIPELKLTDKGLVDVSEFKVIDLFE